MPDIFLPRKKKLQMMDEKESKTLKMLTDFVILCYECQEDEVCNCEGTEQLTVILYKGVL